MRPARKGAGQGCRQAALTRAVLSFNTHYRVGTQVRVWEGTPGVGPGMLATVLTPGAHIHPGRGAVVSVSGIWKTVPLSQVRDAQADISSSFEQPEPL